MRMRSAGFVATMCLTLASAANAAPVTIGFEGTGVDPTGVISPVPLPYVESGFVLHNGPPAAESGIFGANNGGAVNSGSDFFGWAFNGAIILEQENGDPFAFTSLDAGHLGPFRTGPEVLTLQITGNLQGGGAVVTSIDYTIPWATFVLPGTFTNLVSVEFLSGFDGDAAIDNLKVNGTTTVPEGGPLLPLSLSALVLLMLRTARRRDVAQLVR